ncbi:MAG: phytoene/squalene synthase family protein [Bryobacteraceae bacterium]
MLSVEQSYDWCRRLTKQRARNFYYGFALLPRAKRDAICAVYAFMRYCDDLSDEPGADGDHGLAKMAEWRAELDCTLAGERNNNPLWPAFLDVVARYGIPRSCFYDMIDGVSSDLQPQRFDTFEDLYRYCYRVASVAGLSAIYIFGFDSPEAPALAEKCGVAFQLTNILRDVREDAGRGRVYFSEDDMQSVGVSRDEVLRAERTDGLVRLMEHQAARARAYYDASAPLVGLVSKDSRPALWALIEIYRRLLVRIEESGFNVFGPRLRLPAWEKCWIGLLAGVGRRG